MVPAFRAGRALKDLVTGSASASPAVGRAAARRRQGAARAGAIGPPRSTRAVTRRRRIVVPLSALATRSASWAGISTSENASRSSTRPIFAALHPHVLGQHRHEIVDRRAVLLADADVDPGRGRDVRQRGRRGRAGGAGPELVQRGRHGGRVVPLEQRRQRERARGRACRSRARGRWPPGARRRRSWRRRARPGSRSGRRGRGDAARGSARCRAAPAAPPRPRPRAARSARRVGQVEGDDRACAGRVAGHHASPRARPAPTAAAIASWRARSAVQITSDVGSSSSTRSASAATRRLHGDAHRPHRARPARAVSADGRPG